MNSLNYSTKRVDLKGFGAPIGEGNEFAKIVNFTGTSSDENQNSNSNSGGFWNDVPGDVIGGVFDWLKNRDTVKNQPEVVYQQNPMDKTLLFALGGFGVLMFLMLIFLIAKK